jgi:hypothetical protein
VTSTQCADPAPPPADPAASNAAGWVLLAIAIAVALAEWGLVRSHRPTVSQWMRRLRRGWRVLAGSLAGLLLWHMLFGGPI